MKVLFVTTCYPSRALPQYCVFLEQQAQALERSGCKTEVLVLCEGKENVFEKEIYNNIVVTRLGISGNTKKDMLLPTSLSHCDSKKIAQIIANNYDAVSFHFGGLKILRSLLKICKENNTKLVHHFHGLNVWDEYYEKRKWLYNYFRFQKKLNFTKIDAMVGVSNKVTNLFSEKIKKIPAYTVYNGVNLDLFKFKNRDFSKRKTQKILIVANLIELKGHDYLIKAIAEAKQKGIETKLTVAGRGPLEMELKELAKRLDISESVRFTGYIEYEKIADLMYENDIFIMPSYYEALGCVYLEAMSSGMITVGVWRQGIDEIIKDGENGFLVEPKSVGAIVNALERICKKSSDQLKTISTKAKETALKYNWDKSAQMLSSVYQKLEENDE